MSRRGALVLVAFSVAVLAGAPLAWFNSRPSAAMGDPTRLVSALQADDASSADVAPSTTSPPTPTAPPRPTTTVTTVPATTTTTSAPRPVPTTTTTTPPLLDFHPARLDQLEQGSDPIPVWLRVEAIGIDAPVVGYGVDPATGQMEVPGNVTEVGWYHHGPVPGQWGSAVMAAHVDLSGPGEGVFFRLRELEPGDVIRVGYDDGVERAFRVESRAIYLKTELPVDAIFSRRGPAVLTLVTCGGGFNTSIGRYDSNAVVFAVPAQASSEGEATA